jgi:hypothetical protein
LTFALRVWETKHGWRFAPSDLYHSWPAAAAAVKRVYRRGLDPIVELVPCVDVLGNVLPLIPAGDHHWESVNRAWTVGRVDGDTVWCDVPGWLADFDKKHELTTEANT